MPTKNDYFSRTEELENLLFDLREHFLARDGSNSTTESVDEHGVVNDELEDLLARVDDALDHQMPFDEDEEF
jgi:hypothetical protein